jgi:hypothetical protein
MAAWQDGAAPAAREKEAAAARLEKAHEAWDTAITVIDKARKRTGYLGPSAKGIANYGADPAATSRRCAFCSFCRGRVRDSTTCGNTVFDLCYPG